MPDNISNISIVSCITMCLAFVGILSKTIHYKANEKQRFSSPIFFKILLISTLCIMALTSFAITRLFDKTIHDEVLLIIFTTFSVWLTLYLVLATPRIKSAKTIDDLDKAIHERINIENKIIAKNKQLEWAEKTAKICYGNWDINRNVITFSDGAQHVFGIDLGHDLNIEKIAAIVHPEDRGQIKLLTRVSPQSKAGNNSLQFRIVVNGKTRYIQVISEVILDDYQNVMHVRGTFQDVTEQQLSIKKIEDKNRTLKHIAQIQSHDVRGPLATILGLIDLYNNTEDLTEEEIATILQGIRECAFKLDVVIKTIVKQSNTIEQ